MPGPPTEPSGGVAAGAAVERPPNTSTPLPERWRAFSAGCGAGGCKPAGAAAEVAGSNSNSEPADSPAGLAPEELPRRERGSGGTVAAAGAMRAGDCQGGSTPSAGTGGASTLPLPLSLPPLAAVLATSAPGCAAAACTAATMPSASTASRKAGVLLLLLVRPAGSSPAWLGSRLEAPASAASSAALLALEARCCWWCGGGGPRGGSPLDSWRCGGGGCDDPGASPSAPPRAASIASPASQGSSLPPLQGGPGEHEWLRGAGQHASPQQPAKPAGEQQQSGSSGPGAAFRPAAAKQQSSRAASHPPGRLRGGGGQCAAGVAPVGGIPQPRGCRRAGGQARFDL